MKKLVLLALVSLLISCSNDGNTSCSNNGNANYYFKIKINGVEHKVQGNTRGFALGNPNHCSATIGTTTMLGFVIADITKPNYVSGQNMQIIVSIPNCHIGLNQAEVIMTSPVFDAFESSGSWVENSGMYCPITTTNCSYPLFSAYSSKITLNITDMGTSSGYNQSSNLYNYGNTFKGSYNGPVYCTNDWYNGRDPLNFDIPMQFSMEFEAYRIN